jgi:flagellar motor switch protein FliN/FliY
MSDETNTSAEDDWGAALAEQKSVTPQVFDDAKPANIFNKLQPGTGSVGGEGNGDLDLILDIPVTMTVELGRTKIPIKHILQLAQGSVIELDALAGEPMDVLVNGCLIAQGEVVVVNEKFGIRLTDIVTPSERMRRLNR